MAFASWIALCGCAADAAGSPKGNLVGAPTDMGGGAQASGVGVAGAGSGSNATRAGDGGAAGNAGKQAASPDASTSTPTTADGGEPPYEGGVAVPSGAGYLHTQGSKIVDGAGHEVRLTGLSWFGMETSNYAPHGLWARSLDSFLDQIKSLGYNVIRLPFCSQLFDPGSTPNGIDKSPELHGLAGLAIMDKVVAGAGQRGLKIILDRHRPDSNAQSALWYTSQYSEQRWIDDWQMLATHYKGNATVIGFDLHNEPHDPATWGDGNMDTDWRAAAERAGNAVLAINPDLLIIVEGIQTFEKQGYWWGGNLAGAAAHPVRLDVNDRLVYSPHDYPSSVNPQAWFSDPTYPSNLSQVWHDAWGYLADQGVAPIWVGEFGTKNQTSSDQQWLQALTAYIQKGHISFAYWCLNPNSGDTGGILQDDWMSVNQDKQDALQPLLAPLIM